MADLGLRREYVRTGVLNKICFLEVKKLPNERIHVIQEVNPVGIEEIEARYLQYIHEYQ